MHPLEEHKIIETLRSAGINITRCRVAVYKLFNLHKAALSTSYINRYFSGSIDRISVYRSLKLFVKKEILLRVPNTEGEIKYMFTKNVNNNSAVSKTQIAYFICTGCDQMTLLEESVFEQFIIPGNLTVDHCYVLMEGVCKSCN